MTRTNTLFDSQEVMLSIKTMSGLEERTVTCDPKRANVGFRDGRMVIDWQLASVQPSTVDLA